MNTRTVPLYQFMPYGAPELLEAAGRHMTRALVVASSLGLVLFLAGFLAVSQGLLDLHPAPPVVVDLSKAYELQPQIRTPEPPPLPRVEPVKPAAPTTAKVANAVPVPVRDEVADPEVTIKDQTDVPAPAPVATGPLSGSGNPAGDAIPRPYDYVYVDQDPVPTKPLVASYPDMARQAQLEGLVMVRVLVGTDGRVKDAIVEKSVPMLDPAALETARRATFKPAMVNGHPVAVWVSIPFRFTLKG